jgi:hemerythrin superfamily protein
MDAVTLLRNDHRTVEKMFKEFERLHKKGGSDAQKQRLVAKIIKELSVHTAIEEEIFYPAVRSEVDGADDTILESLEEHHVAKWVLSELESMGPETERFDAKTTVLIESVRHHVEEEEQELFPEVREAMGRKRLTELAEQMEAAKRKVPKSPQPQPAVGMRTRASRRTGKRVSAPRGRTGTRRTAAQVLDITP